MRRGLTPVVAVVLLLMMSVTAAGGAYAWITTTTQQAQSEASDSLSARLTVRDVACEPGAVKFVISNTGDRAVDAGDTDLYVRETGGDLNTTREAVNLSGTGFERPGGVAEIGFLLSTKQRPGTAYRFELVFGRSDYRTSARCEVQRNALPGAVGGYDASSTYRQDWRVESAGYCYGGSCGSAPDDSYGFWREGTREFQQGRSYGIVVLDRDTGTITLNRTYDVFGGAAAAGNLASQLDSLGPDRLVFIGTYDEPEDNRLANGMDLEMNQTGAGPVFTNGIRHRSAYLLIGYHGLGPGRGIERYRGDTSADPDAHVVFNMTVIDGNVGRNDIYR